MNRCTGIASAEGEEVLQTMEIIKIGDRNLSYFKPFFSEEPLPGQGALGILNEDGQPVGAGVFTVLGESCVLDDLYVEENSRRKGAGSRAPSGTDSAIRP